MSTDETSPPGGSPKRRRRRRSKAMRRVSGTLALFFALTALALTYNAAVPTDVNTAVAANLDEEQIAQGQQLFQAQCVTCHGTNLQGILDRGPSLIGVGEASVYFQLSTGRMPATENAAQMSRKAPAFTPEQIDAIGQYIQANGGGPVIPDGSLRDDSQVALGGELYRLNCASCHNFTGKGGALSQGKYAPALDQATDEQIWGAMLSGPESMPKFGDAQLTPEEKQAIVAYVQSNDEAISPGGYAAGGFGPAPEGLIAFLVGMGAIVAATLWMGSRA